MFYKIWSAKIPCTDAEQVLICGFKLWKKTRWIFRERFLTRWISLSASHGSWGIEKEAVWDIVWQHSLAEKLCVWWGVDGRCGWAKKGKGWKWGDPLERKTASCESHSFWLVLSGIYDNFWPKNCRCLKSLDGWFCADLERLGPPFGLSGLGGEDNG